MNAVNSEVRDRIRVEAIPAESFAAGANPIGGVSGNYNYQNENGTPNGWPRKDGAWRHSDIKDVSYYYVWKLFEKIKKGE